MTLTYVKDVMNNKMMHHIDEETARQDYIENVFIGIKKQWRHSTQYNRCLECNQLNTYENWCQSCNAARFQRGFSTWTSGNAKIDYFIQNTQIHALNGDLVIEWYPWQTFSEIDKIGQGGYGTVFRAKTKLHRIKKWNYKNKDWVRHQIIRDHNEYFALKSIGDPGTLSSDFLNEAKGLQRWAYQVTCSSLFGFTKNEATGQYFLVMKYFHEGNLCRQLQRQATDWKEKIRMIYFIANYMNIIHKAGMIHRNLHPGNILYSGSYQIGDLGLSILQSEAGGVKEVVGVMPYIAPELFLGDAYSQATDIYAFGIIMWEISSSERPFCEFAHDEMLASLICGGFRPSITKDTPRFYRDLMQKCWDPDPAKRPTAEQIYEYIYSWYIYPTRVIRGEIEKAEEIFQNTMLTKTKRIQHPEAIYQSRIMPNISNLIHFV